jgi:poly-gamma-glutamate synthesis protein (capsule biosynthesis protein)
MLPGCQRQSAERKVTLAAVGDILLARGVGKQIAAHGENYPFEKTREIISGADIAFFNLECPLSRRGLPRRRRFLFRADPDLARALRSTGFDAACLANNHTLDYGRDAMLDTGKAVEEVGMLPIGAGKNRADSTTVRVIERRGLRIGFLAYTDIPTCGVVRLDDRPTIAGVNADSLGDEVRAAKSGCDALVVSFHWGIEYSKHPAERQRKLAHICIENGADLILGHHPHVLQTVETYREKPIIYSMGGFVWDGVLPKTKESAIYLFEIGRSSARIVKTVPLRIVKCRPQPQG